MSSCAPGFENATEQREPVDLKVHGEIPSWLSGILYRTGPGTTRIPRTADPSKVVDIHHWFDGLAMHHRFEIHSETQRVSYRSRKGAEDVERYIADTGEFPGYSFGQQRDPCQSLFRKFFSVWDAASGALGPSGRNVNVTLTPDMPGWNAVTKGLPILSPSAAKSPMTPRYLVAKTDSDRLQLLDPETLDPLAQVTYSQLDSRLDGVLAAAHACRDAVSGDFYNFVCKFAGRFPTYKVFCIRGHDGGVDILAEIKDAPPAYIHSFAITERFIVLCVWQAYYKHYGMSILLNKNLAQSITTDWDPTADTLIYVIDRMNGGVIAIYKTQPFFCFHHLNAFDDPATGDVVIDMSVYPNNTIIELTKYASLRDLGALTTPFTYARARRFRLPAPLSSPPQSGTRDAVVEYTFPIERNIELPVVAPRVRNRPYRFAYGIHKVHIPGRHTLSDALIKLDMAAGAAGGEGTKVWEVPDGTPSEPIFVPRPGAAPGEEGEDDGVLLTVVLDERAVQSRLVILDARKMREVARAEMDTVFPIGFHGVFCG
ncbi:carotenoid oxygenase [Laetiporus sulphureus 93-53]|uniref:Carotenoid oxygenase n=1 Tax=Laetiporus sulphureus 93-53 TaxID=1314785 RepID=A0A165EM67_9APHY|nr:carotenoid oxygenase [Laetiporus sulphureus 93-53]KZT07349.1 carotenoid oxygenase [Laetiporus sulphureus 93-53]